MIRKSRKKNFKVLDLGCGKKKKVGAIGVDWSNRHNADIVHDLNKFPYPFKKNSIDLIYIDNCLEHLNEPIKVMEELYRILKINSLVKVTVPYFRSRYAFIDPTHKTFYTINSFDYYDPSCEIYKRYEYTSIKFKIEKIIFNENLISKNWIKNIVLKIANKHHALYEGYLSHLVPLDDITFILKKI